MNPSNSRSQGNRPVYLVDSHTDLPPFEMMRLSNTKPTRGPPPGYMLVEETLTELDEDPQSNPQAVTLSRVYFQKETLGDPSQVDRFASNGKRVVKKTGKFYDKPSSVPTYQTHSRKRGEMLLINNIMFSGHGDRHGAEKDSENIQSLFGQMGFEGFIEQNLTASRMETAVKAFSKRSSLSSADIAVVVVMSHGAKHATLGATEVCGVDQKRVLVEKLIDHFNEKNCKQMAGKPKIFIFQCCRGNHELFLQTDATALPKMPALTNALIAYSTLPGFVSYRDPTHGSLFITTICDVFSQHAHEQHVEDLLKMVDVELGKVSKDVKQTTHYENRGFKRCYLHPV